MAIFNSQQYAWKDLTVAIDGNIIGGITDISYSTTTEHEYLYARGSAPVAIQSGNETYEGSITLLQSEYEALNQAVKALGYKNLTKPYLTITVAYAEESGIPKVDVIKFLKISETPKGMSQNDKFMEVEMPFMALDVRENA